MSNVRTADAAWTDLAHIFHRNGSIGDPTAPISGSALEEERARWQRVIEQRLLLWAQDPSALADDGLTPPSAEVLRAACQLAQDLRDAGLPAPDRVAATGDGGLVFARQAGPCLTTLEIDADGSVERVEFRDARLVSRQRLR